MTQAVTRALEERLDRLEARETEDNAEKRAEKWVAIGKEIAARLKEPYKSVEHGDLLYDEMGLPK
jgi:antitoxin VapB